MPQVVVSQVSPITLPTEDLAWQNDPVVEQAKDLFFIGRDLWSAATNEMIITDSYGGASSGGGSGWLVAGRQDLLIFTDNHFPAWGFVPRAPRIRSQGENWMLPGMEMCIPPARCQDRAIQAPTGGHGPFLNQDFRRVIYFKDGDLWRAEVDWLSREFINHRQVTQIGILNPDRSGNIAPIAWHGNTLLLRTRFSQERPILRVELTNGEIEELASLLVFENNMFANPSASRLCAPHGELLACYEMQTGETFRITLPYEVHPSLFQGVTTPVSGRQPASVLWAGDDLLLIAIQDQPDLTGHRGHILRVDFQSRLAEELFTTHGYTFRLETIPGGRHVVAAWDEQGIRGQPRTGPGKVRLSIEDGNSVQLPAELEPDGVWIDSDKYLYIRQRGGISEIGTWLYDIENGDSRRICHLPASLSLQNPHPALYFPERDAIYMNARPVVLRADLTTGGCENFADVSGNLAPLLTPPVNLQLDITGEALWEYRAVTVTERQTPVPDNRQGVNPNEPTGLEAVLKTIEGLPFELQEEVQVVYRNAQSNTFLSSNFDTACFAAEFLAWRQEDAQRPRSLFERDNERYAHCADGEKIAYSAAIRTPQMLRGSQFSEDEIKKISECTGESVAESFIANPPRSPRQMSNLYVESLTECRRQHTN